MAKKWRFHTSTPHLTRSLWIRLKMALSIAYDVTNASQQLWRARVKSEIKLVRYHVHLRTYSCKKTYSHDFVRYTIITNNIYYWKVSLFCKWALLTSMGSIKIYIITKCLPRSPKNLWHLEAQKTDDISKNKIYNFLTSGVGSQKLQIPLCSFMRGIRYRVIASQQDKNAKWNVIQCYCDVTYCHFSDWNGPTFLNSTVTINNVLYSTQCAGQCCSLHGSFSYLVIGRGIYIKSFKFGTHSYSYLQGPRLLIIVNESDIEFRAWAGNYIHTKLWGPST